MKKVSKSVTIREMLNAGKSVEAIVKKLKVTPALVYTVRWQAAQKNKQQNKRVRKKLHDLLKRPSVLEIKTIEQPKDEVNHPEHYTYGGIETWDFIEAKELSYHLASVIKYVSRAGKKEGNTELKDLKKAREHLDRRIKQLVNHYPV